MLKRICDTVGQTVGIVTIPAGHKYLKSYNLSLVNHVVRNCMKINWHEFRHPMASFSACEAIIAPIIVAHLSFIAFLLCKCENFLWRMILNYYASILFEVKLKI